MKEDDKVVSSISRSLSLCLPNSPDSPSSPAIIKLKCLRIYNKRKQHRNHTHTLPCTQITRSLPRFKWHCVCKGISNIQCGTEIPCPLDMALSAVYETSYANSLHCTCCCSILATALRVDHMGSLPQIMIHRTCCWKYWANILLQHRNRRVTVAYAVLCAFLLDSMSSGLFQNKRD